MIRSRFQPHLAFFILGACVLPAFLFAQDAQRIRVEPKPNDELFANPGMGWQTFHRFADEDPNLQGLPSASAYFRFYWREVEPTAGAIDFKRFDELLAHARRAGQKLAFRIMCTGSGQYMDVPAWLKDQGCRGFEFSSEGRKHWVPDFEDSRFQDAHFRLIRELGRRYDGNPDLDLLDIGSVGLWGEWHMSGTSRSDNGKTVDLPSPALRLAIIDEWCRAFPQTPKVILIGSEEGMRIAAAKSCGWRADCLGDMGGFSKNWNHMDHFYLQQLDKTGSQETWKVGPVAFESCWDMRKWKDSNWNIRHIFDYALRCHLSYLNNKSAPIPDGTRGDIERLLRSIGFRLVLRSAEHDSAARPGSALQVNLEWENIGVAPPYRDYRLALALTNPQSPEKAPLVLSSEESIRGWLPGTRNTNLKVHLPADAPPGRYRLALGLVAPGTILPEVRLAIAGRTSDGWYPLSELELKR